MRVHLLVNVPTMKLKAGTDADLKDPFAQKLLASGGAITVEDAKKLLDADAAKAKLEAASEKAEKDTVAKREAAKKAVRERSEKARADAEESRIKALRAKRDAILKKTEEPSKAT
jgi:hypothetical protein